MEARVLNRTLKKGKLMYFSLLFHGDSCRPVAITKCEYRIPEACLERSRKSTVKLFCKKAPS